MMTPFNLIQSLRSWFFARDGDIVLQDGRAIKISNADITITTGGIVITGATVTIGGAAVSVAGHSHTITHASTTGQTVNDHHNQSHAIDGGDHSGTLAHSALGTVTANQHHNQAHAIDGADHTGTLSDGQIPSSIARDSEVTSSISTHASSSDHDSLYHLKTTFSDTTGSTSKPLKTDTSGLLYIAGFGAGVAPAANRIQAVGEVRAGGLVCGATNVSSGTGRLLLTEISTPGTPPSGTVYIWAATSGRVYSKDDTGTVRELSN